MTRAIVLALATTGCAQLFGIDTTTGSGIDAPGPGVHATIQRVSIGATTMTSALDQTQTMDHVTFLDPDGMGGYQKVPGNVIAMGSWQADLAAGNPVVDYTVLGVRKVWAFPTRDLHAATVLLEHGTTDLAPTGATLTMNVTIPALQATESFQLEAIGAWTYHSFAAGELPAMGGTTISSTIAYTSFAPFAAGAPLRRIIPDDQVVLLRYLNGTELTGVFQTSIDQTDTNTLTGTLAPVTEDKAIDANINPSTLATRYTAVRPAVGTLAQSWAVYAAPGFQKIAASGPALQSGGLGMADTKIAKPYGNPFASLGWNELLVYATSESRTATLPGGETLGLAAQLVTVTAPAMGMTLDLPAGLPLTVSLEQMPLTSDNMAIQLDPAKYAHVTILADHAANTMYRATLYEVIPMAPGAKLQYVVESLSNDPQSLVLPPDAFQAGHTYVIEAVCFQGGYPNVATGDLVTTSPPIHYGVAMSGVFTVQNP